LRDASRSKRSQLGFIINTSFAWAALLSTDVGVSTAWAEAAGGEAMAGFSPVNGYAVMCRVFGA
ncbi:hypothetical protein CKO42_10635, partial [Lamprobacter modestohalophilus]|nr:hypothetical protein [Lamprobacter modestohalophilus]